MTSAAQVEPTRETFFQIGAVGEAVFYYLAAVAVVFFLYGLYDRFGRYMAGAPEKIDRLDDLPKRIVTAAVRVASNTQLFDRDRYAGVMHTFILWGFLTLLIGTTILAIDMDIYQRVLGTSFFVGDFYLAYSFVMDALGFLFVVGIGMALYRRYWTRMERLHDVHTSLEDDAFIWTLFVLGVGGYVTEGLRILATEYPPFETVSFVGWFVADVFSVLGFTPADATAVYPLAWWSHALIALGFVAWVPWAKPFHMLSSFANVVATDPDSGRRLPGVPADVDPDDIGFTSAEDFSWKHILDQDACTKCGRCSAVCPAKASGRNLDPRNVILDLKTYREDVDAGRTGEKAIVADGGASVIQAETMESCMTCMACVDACPVDIDHLNHFTEMNRRLTEMGEMDPNVQDTMMNIFGKGNSFGEPERARTDWTDDLDFEVPDARERAVDLLWYVGDYPSYDDRNNDVAVALAKIFEAAGVNYGILYDDERYDGNDVRRVGEEGLFEMLVEDNSTAIMDCAFDRIVTTDPHSYNTFKNEYPDFEACEWTGDDVMHYTEVVEDLVTSGALQLTGDVTDTVTYHDPCHLGRYNDVYDEPRAVIDATGAERHEMPRNRSDSFCCGGGGGGLWMDFQDEPKPSEERLREAIEDTDAGDAVDTFVVACPRCVTMYEDGRKTGNYEDDIEIVDLTELVVKAL